MGNLKDLKLEIGIPEGVSVKVDNTHVSVKGKSGEASKEMHNPKIKVFAEANKIVIEALKPTRREQRIAYTFNAHIKNLIKGAAESYIYKLKICSGHFPMNVSTKGNELIVKNFFGEKVPRVLKLKERVNVKVEGDIITVTSANKELAGQAAADIEQLTRRTRFDTRVFQDGIWIIEKEGMN
ncbi:MAG TPA: 50S ribosomal protein L6 [Candidatus Nanoarchaeia archaeon]|nr:50S ribosomal protein L6 [Candidatus Nanoarchaeia archaeon]